MAQIKTKFLENSAVTTAKIADDAIETGKIANNAVNGSKIRLANDEQLKARNAANTADVNILKVNTSDRIEFASVPQAGADPVGSNDLVRKSYADGLVSGLVVDAITDGVTTSAPSQNAVFDALALKIDDSEKGAPNGVATLDAGGKVPVAQLPSSVMTYEGTWNASTNTPTLANGTGDAGQIYIVSTAGSQNLGSGSITFAVGDWVIYNGATWEKVTNSNAVASVNGFTGAVVLDTDDIAEGATNKYQKTWGKESITLIAGDITNQYVDLAQTIINNSLDLVVAGVVQAEGVDYSVALTGGAGGVTRVTFLGDLATGGNAALVAGDVLRLKYQY